MSQREDSGSDPTEEPEYTDEPDQTNPKTKRNDLPDGRDDDAEDRAATDSDADQARSAVTEMEDESGDQSQLTDHEGGEGDESTTTDTSGEEGDGTGTATSEATVSGGQQATSAESTTGGGVADESDVDPALNPGGSDSPLAAGAIEDSYRDVEGAVPQSAPVSEPSHPNRVGGWDGFSTDQIEGRSALLEADVQGGASQQNMEILSLSADADAERAFVTQYGPGGNDWEKAHSQMATYAFADAVGLEYPAHTFDEESQQVIVEDVADEGESAATLWDISDEDSDASPEWTDRVDRDELLSHYATHLLMGNNDLHGGNVMISEEGRVYTFDGDKSIATYESADGLKESLGVTGDSVRHLEENRTEPLDITQEDIVEEARSMAIQLQETGQKEALLDHVGKYDEQFAGRSDRVYRDRLEQNMDALIYDIPGI